MNMYKIKRNNNIPIGFYEEKTTEKANIFSRIETKITFNRQEYYQNILYKFDSGEVDLLYEGKERKGIIMGGSSNGLTIIGLLKED